MVGGAAEGRPRRTGRQRSAGTAQLIFDIRVWLTLSLPRSYLLSRDGPSVSLEAIPVRRM